MPDDIDDILRRVAAGDLAPEAALVLLDGDEQPTGAPAYPPGEVTRIRIVAAYRPVDVIGDPTVAELFVDGPHSVRRESGLVVVEAPEWPSAAADPDARPGDEERQGRFSFASLPRTLAWARAWKDHHLSVRVNPHLPLELEITGGQARLSGTEAGVDVRLLASSLKVDRLRGYVTLDVMSSSVKGFVGPTGRSRISAESSSVKLSLLAGTDLRIHARNRLGKVVLPTRVTKGGFPEGEVVDSVVGTGRDSLDIDALMSSVVIGTGGAGEPR